MLDRRVSYIVQALLPFRARDASGISLYVFVKSDYEEKKSLSLMNMGEPIELRNSTAFRSSLIVLVVKCLATLNDMAVSSHLIILVTIKFCNILSAI